MRRLLPWIAVAALATALFLLFTDWAPCQWASMAAYTGLVTALLGAICAVFPFRFVGVRKRRVGAMVAAGGLLLTLAALLWPAPTVHVTRHATRLDDIMPDYNFYERHEARVHAAPAQVMAAIQRATFQELPAYVTLMRVRGAVLRQPVHTSETLGRMRIVDVMSNPRSGFLPLDRGEYEMVMGMAGRPWASGPKPMLEGASAFASFQQPEAVKIAFNLRVEDMGNGWSLVTTETRILGLDGPGRRTMGRYWRLVVPGSGMIRRQWLHAIRKRAEGANASPVLRP